MLNKIKALPHKTSFAIGILLLLLGSLLPFNLLTKIIGGILWVVGFLFIIIASDKKHSNN